ncbi:MAG: cbb3-type cytochrome c oxidase N-terminal domain-containing protein [Desulfatirhabdiaceae bacterium]
MRYFNLLNIQHIVLAIFPALSCVVLVGVALAFAHFRGRNSEDRQTQVTATYPDGIRERNAPFPLFLFLVILGTVLWGIAYILMFGLTGKAI